MNAETPARPLRYWSPVLVGLLAVWAAIFFTMAGGPVAWIARGWMFVPVGFAGALLGNISAVGGGIVFIPVFVAIFHLPPVMALKIALATQSFGMTSGAIGWLQKGAVPLAALRIAVPGLLIGSSVSTFVIHPNALLIRLLFGPVSIALGVLILVIARRGGTLRDLPDHARWLLFAVAVFGGLITGWVAIGEGEVVAALLMLAYGMEASACIALGVVLLSINSIFLALAHQFLLGGIPWEIASFTALGAIFGARLAPWLARHADARRLKLIFAAIAIVDGTLFVIQSVNGLFR